MNAHVLRFGERGKVVRYERTGEGEVLLILEQIAHWVSYDARAEGYSRLMVFDGHLLRDGMPHGSKPLSFKAYGKKYRSGELEISHKTTSGKIKRSDSVTGLPRDCDKVTEQGGVAVTSYFLHMFQFPKGRTGTRGIFMRPKPLSLEREYIRIVSTPEAATFETCVTF